MQRTHHTSSFQRHSQLSESKQYANRRLTDWVLKMSSYEHSEDLISNQLNFYLKNEMNAELRHTLRLARIFHIKISEAAIDTLLESWKNKHR